MTNRRLLFVHAHPDDDASKGAATAARYVDEGAEVVLVTCTGGEAGEVLNPSAEAVTPEQMPTVRAAELAAAVDAVGFTRTYGMGYHDSGYHEDPADVPEGTFARVPLDDPSTALAQMLRKERPHVVVTYPENGGYPHPDHIMTYLVTMRALELAEDPGAGLAGEPWRVPKVYASTVFTTERVYALHEAMLERHDESPFEHWLKRIEDRPTPSPEPDALIEVGDWLERRDAALRAHVTQIDPDGFWFAVPRDLEREVFPYEGFLLLRTDVPVRTPENDLFAGLDLE
jgi:mycothiol S-conjugate amidase